MGKLRRATAGMTTRAKADEKWLTNIRSRHTRLLKLSDLGWAQLPKERMFALVKLETSIMVGVSMIGGTPRTERIEVGSENSDLPEYYTRQFVTEAEANFLKEVERRVGSDPGVNAIMGGVRGLQRLTEVDDCLLRMTKNGYEEYFKGDIGVFTMTIVHE